MAAYIDLLHSGELHKRSEVLAEKLRECTLCPRECRVNRTKDDVTDIPNDYAYIFAGGELPNEFLTKIGVRIDKRFGT